MAQRFLRKLNYEYLVVGGSKYYITFYLNISNSYSLYLIIL